MTRRVRRALLLVALLGCGHDAAEREYLAALRGDEDGSTRAEQLAHLNRAIELAPDRPGYWKTRAVYRIDDRDFAGAESDLDRSLALASHPYQHFLRGLVRCQRGNPAAAIADLDLAIETQPENTQFYRGRSLALSALGRHAEALADADHLVATGPQQATSHHARGVALAGLGRHAEAIAELDIAHSQRPELVYPLRARAESHARLGDDEAAARDRQAAREHRYADGRHGAYTDPFRY